jgi:hypothetical protein
MSAPRLSAVELRRYDAATALTPLQSAPPIASGATHIELTLDQLGTAHACASGSLQVSQIFVWVLVLSTPSGFFGPWRTPGLQNP